MADLPKYQKSDFKRVSWEEYGETLEFLYQKVSKYLKENNIKIDAVVPIFRGGAIPGTYLAYKLHLLKILPVQYKYFVIDGKHVLKNLISIPKENLKISENPTFLVVENNHCFGGTSKMAINDLKKIIPGCKIIYAAAHMDYSYQEMEQAEVVFYGKLTNECWKLFKEEALKKGLDMFLSLFPWEDLEEEWATVTVEEFEYV